MIGNTSSTCMEALAYGVPVVIAGSRTGLTQNPIPDTVPTIMWELCYTVDEIHQSIIKLCIDADDIKRKEYAQIAKDIRKDFFEPITQDGVYQFLNLI